MAYTRESIYKLWLSELKVDLIAEYNKLGLKASGKYEKDLEGTIEGNKITMWGAFHSQFMELGRRAGKMAPVAAILQWIEDKRIRTPASMTQRAFAFIIARKIGREGIKVPNKFNEGGVLSKVITEARIMGLITSIKFVEVDTITSDILNLIKAA